MRVFFFFFSLGFFCFRGSSFFFFFGFFMTPPVNPAVLDGYSGSSFLFLIGRPIGVCSCVARRDQGRFPLTNTSNDSSYYAACVLQYVRYPVPLWSIIVGYYYRRSLYALCYCARTPH